MRKLLITLGVLLIVGVGLDVGGRAYAESKLAGVIADRTGVSPEPDVGIQGFSFLWQVVTGSYQSVTVDFPQTQVGDLGTASASVDAREVTLSLSDAIGGKVDQLTAGTVSVSATFPATAVRQMFPTGEVTLAQSGDALVATTTAAISGRSFTVSAVLQPTISNNVLHLKGVRLSGNIAGIPAAMASTLLTGLTVDIPLTGLPFTISSGSVRAVDGALVVDGTARDVPLGELIRYAQRDR